MKNTLKINVLAVFATIFVSWAAISGIPQAVAQEKTLTEYLYNKDVSFLIVSGQKLTTFGQESAKAVCKDIKEAGFSVKTVRNYSKDQRVETVVSCS